MIALRSGALPEIVEDGVTGFFVDDEEPMADAIRRIGEIDRATCFDSRLMAERYIALL